MKIHAFIISLIVLTCSSCKVTSYEYVETLELPIVDTVEIPSLHHHYVEDSSYKCVYHTSVVFHESDTLYIDIYHLRERRTLKPKQRR
jgi:hypothetical protein